MTETATSKQRFAPLRTLGDYVNHDNVFVRFVSLWLLLVVLFMVTWQLAYSFLPEGLLRSSNPNRSWLDWGYAGSVTGEFLLIFAVNLTSCLVIVAMNTLRSIRTPAGYVVATITWLQGAVTWGTNSLAVEAGRLAPSLSVLLGRSGMFELTAYVAVAVATREVVIWHQQSGPRWREEFERVRSPRDWHLSRNEWLVLLGGLALLALANYREALMISRVLG